MLVEKSLRLSSALVDNETIYWLEGRPEEKGRVALMKEADGKIEEVLPKECNVRTLVHEYGGGAFTVKNGVIFFSNFSDQALYRFDGKLTKIAEGGKRRYADYSYDPTREKLYAICEEHDSKEPKNFLVQIDSTGTQTIAEGADFYASPTFSPDGKKLAWIEWNHPNMPWDGTELYLLENGEKKKIAGGKEISIFQPQFGPDGKLYYVSDESGFWNLYCEGKNLCPKEAEFGFPGWLFGFSRYAFLEDGRIACTYTIKGNDHLAILDNGELKKLDLPFTSYGYYLHAKKDALIFFGSSSTEPAALIEYDLASKNLKTLRKSAEISLDKEWISKAQLIEFPTSQNKTAFAFFYPPKNLDYEAPQGELPPLIVKSHGGPSGNVTGSFNFEIQYWTSRGFAVVDVNYGGSTGHGRAYRERLNGNWGIVDVEDCINAALYLADQGLVDKNRLAIKGGSAGGYTTLAALVFHDIFKAGVSYYGVSDLEALSSDTHKFEARYNDRLIGPYPEQKELYIKRSPIHSIDQLSCPILFFQGSEDKIVPPSQSESMYKALKAKNIPTAYVLFEKEQHGFRDSENIKRAIETEYLFYSKIFNFEPADQLNVDLSLN